VSTDKQPFPRAASAMTITMVGRAGQVSNERYLRRVLELGSRSSSGVLCNSSGHSGSQVNLARGHMIRRGEREVFREYGSHMA